jgi:hypothetical protein
MLTKLEEYRLFISQDPMDKLRCKEKALVDCIKYIHYAWPEQYTLLGLGNRLWANFRLKAVD